MPVAEPIALAPAELDAVRFNEHGLVAAIVQDEANGQILMMAWMNAETLAQSLSQGRTVFWSRSRSEVWRKGDTSGDRQFIRSAYYDCDGDTLLFVVDQEGKGACHTGERSCFYRAFGSGSSVNGGASASGDQPSEGSMAPVWSVDSASKVSRSGLPVGKEATGGTRSEAEMGPARSEQGSRSGLPVGKEATGGTRSEAEMGPTSSNKGASA